MIHNITEEREKRYHQDVSPVAAITDEELLRLIEQVEERELIRAPRNLKEEIFQRIDREKKRKHSRRLISYRVQVLAGMAAALTVLLFLPIEGQNASERERPVFVNHFWQKDEKTANDEWEKAVYASRQEIDRKWESYQRKQERKEAGERYVQEIKDYFTNNFIWED